MEKQRGQRDALLDECQDERPGTKTCEEDKEVKDRTGVGAGKLSESFNVLSISWTHNTGAEGQTMQMALFERYDNRSV